LKKGNLTCKTDASREEKIRRKKKSAVINKTDEESVPKE
jgi:hypothetical protein